MHCRQVTVYAILIVPVMSGCMDRAALSSNAASGVASKAPISLPIHATVDLGVIIQGESVQTNRWIRNQGDKPIRIAKIEKSCECVDLKIIQSEIQPGEKAFVQISYDGAKEPDFTGALQIEVTLLEDSGQSLGSIQVPVEVVSKTTAGL
jgi:hypothetical protein